MRVKSFLLFLLVAGAVAAALTVTGQEEPLPAVQPRATTVASYPFLSTLEAPIEAPPTLAEAASRNDFATFDALYRAARERGEAVDAFEGLHEQWTFAMTDPIGAFYGAERFERIAAAHPGFAAYIERHKVVDRNGNAFYPSSETRAFLLARALESTATAQSGELLTALPAVVRRRVPAVQARADAAVAATAGTARGPMPAPVVAPVPVAVVPRDAVAADATDLAAATPAPVAVETAVPVRPAPVAVAPTAVPPAVPVRAAATPRNRGMLLLAAGLLALAILAVIHRLNGPAPALSRPRQGAGGMPHEPSRVTESRG